MFDFSRWSKFVEAKSTALRDRGFEVTFRAIKAPVAKATVEIENTNVLAAFYFWDTGFADYDVMDAKSNKFIANETNKQFTNQTFEGHFGQFIIHCLKFREQ